jgi:hypothetical protein
MHAPVETCVSVTKIQVILNACFILVYDCFCASGAVTRAIIQAGGDSIVEEGRKIGLYVDSLCRVSVFYCDIAGSLTTRSRSPKIVFTVRLP